MKMIYESLGHEYMSKKCLVLETNKNDYLQLNSILHVGNYDDGYEGYLTFRSFAEILEKVFEFWGNYYDFLFYYGYPIYAASGSDSDFVFNTDFVIDCLGQYKYCLGCCSGAETLFQGYIDNLINIVLPLIAQKEPDFVRGLLFDLILCCNLLQLYELQSQFLQCKYKLNLTGGRLEML